MTFLRYLFLGLLALCLIVLALANRGNVTLRLLPEELGLALGFGQGVTMPLFLVIFLAIAIGLLVGFVWEWLREHKHRVEARTQRSERERLEKQISRSKPSETDDVLALLDTSR
ncbi:MAG: LapA family protein [Jannaschia sp.]